MSVGDSLFGVVSGGNMIVSYKQRAGHISDEQGQQQSLLRISD